MYVYVYMYMHGLVINTCITACMVRAIVADGQWSDPNWEMDMGLDDSWSLVRWPENPQINALGLRWSILCDVHICTCTRMHMYAHVMQAYMYMYVCIGSTLYELLEHM